jgi:hypothetical protein
MYNYFYDLPIELQTYIIQIKSADSIRNSWYKFIDVKTTLFTTLNKITSQICPRCEKDFQIMYIALKKTSTVITGKSDCPDAWRAVLNNLKFFIYIETSITNNSNFHPIPRLTYWCDFLYDIELYLNIVRNKFYINDTDQEDHFGNFGNLD